MKYRYLYQNKTNQNCEGEIEARDRADAYTKLRKAGIRPYRVIGDDPFNWRPLLFWFAVFSAFLTTGIALCSMYLERREAQAHIKLSPEEAREFRARAEEAVMRAPDPYRYNIWRGINARLKERGLEPIPKPQGLVEEDAFAPVGFSN